MKERGRSRSVRNETVTGAVKGDAGELNWDTEREDKTMSSETGWLFQEQKSKAMPTLHRQKGSGIQRRLLGKNLGKSVTWGIRKETDPRFRV